MATDSDSLVEGSIPKSTGRRSLNIFRRVGMRMSSSKYDDVPSESSGDDRRSFTHTTGKKLKRPDPLLRSSSDRGHDDWMGAGHDARSPVDSFEASRGTKPLPAQSQASPTLNLFGPAANYSRPEQSNTASTPYETNSSLYDPHRAAYIPRTQNVKVQDGSKVNYSRPSSRNASPSPRPNDDTRSSRKDSRPYQAAMSAPSPAVMQERAPQPPPKIREVEPHLQDFRVAPSNDTSAWERPSATKHENANRPPINQDHTAPAKGGPKLQPTSNASTQTFTPIEASFRKSIKDEKAVEKLLQKCEKRRKIIKDLEKRAKDHAHAQNWTELQVLVVKIDREKTEMAKLESKLASLRGQHPAHDFLASGRAKGPSSKPVAPLLSESSLEAPSAELGGVTDNAKIPEATRAITDGKLAPATKAVPSKVDEKSNSARTSKDAVPQHGTQNQSAPAAPCPSVSLYPILSAEHPNAALEKTLLRDIQECENRLADWIGVVAKAVNSTDVLLKQKAWQYKTNAIPQFTKYVALRREELEKLRHPEEDTANDNIGHHEPTKLSDIEDGPEGPGGDQDSQNAEDVQIEDHTAQDGRIEKATNRNSTVRWPLLDEREDHKIQPSGSLSTQKTRLDSLDWATSPTIESVIELPEKAAVAPETTGLFSISPRRRSKNITEEEAAKLKEAKTLPQPSTPPAVDSQPFDKLHRRSKSTSSAIPSPSSFQSTRRPSSSTFAPGQTPLFKRELDYSSLEKSYHDVLEKLKALNSEREYWERKLTEMKEERDRWIRVARERGEEVERLGGKDKET